MVRKGRSGTERSLLDADMLPMLAVESILYKSSADFSAPLNHMALRLLLYLLHRLCSLPG